jgi:hypothetical protein
LASWPTTGNLPPPSMDALAITSITNFVLASELFLLAG